MSASTRVLGERIARSATMFELGESGAELIVDEKAPPCMWMLRRADDEPRTQ